MATKLGIGITELTKWPEYPLSEPAKLIIHKFYYLVDTETDEARLEFLKLFTLEGMMVIGPKIIKGRAALEQERRQAWIQVGQRKHRVLKVYVTNVSGLDVFVLGRIDVQARNGRSFTQEFSANFLLVEEDDQLLISEFRAYIDTAPLAKATAET